MENGGRSRAANFSVRLDSTNSPLRKELSRTSNTNRRGWTQIRPEKVLADIRALIRLRIGNTSSTAIVDEEIFSLLGMNFYHYDGRHLGRLTGFSFAEYKALGTESAGRKKARHVAALRPYDATDEDIRLYLNEFNRPKRNATARRLRAVRSAQRAIVRADIAKDASLHDRARSLCEIADEWLFVRDAAKKLCRDECWRAPNGDKLKQSSIIREINRLLPMLGRYVEVEIETDVRGWAKRRFRSYRQIQ